MGGSSGGVVQILLTAAAAAAQKQESSSEAAQQPLLLRVALALEAGCGSVTQFGGATVGDRTMLDALVPALHALKTTALASSSASAAGASALKAAAEAARQGADHTRNMVGRAGRSNYVSGDALREADPGAEAVALLFATAAKHAAGSSS
jgi:dihydroxyacetone kinase